MVPVFLCVEPSRLHKQFVSCVNGILLIATQTELVWCGPRQILHQPPNQPLVTCNRVMLSVPVIRHLGVWIGSDPRHVIKILVYCFAVLRQLRESLTGLFLVLVTPCWITAIELPNFQPDRLQSVNKTAACQLFPLVVVTTWRHCWNSSSGCPSVKALTSRFACLSCCLSGIAQASFCFHSDPQFEGTHSCQLWMTFLMPRAWHALPHSVTYCIWFVPVAVFCLNNFSIVTQAYCDFSPATRNKISAVRRYVYLLAESVLFRIQPRCISDTKYEYELALSNWKSFTTGMLHR